MISFSQSRWYCCDIFKWKFSGILWYLFSYTRSKITPKRLPVFIYKSKLYAHSSFIFICDTDPGIRVDYFNCGLQFDRWNSFSICQFGVQSMCGWNDTTNDWHNIVYGDKMLGTVLMVYHQCWGKKTSSETHISKPWKMVRLNFHMYTTHMCGDVRFVVVCTKFEFLFH